MVIKFWGTRGSIPVPGASTIKYGGNTPCIEIRENAEFIIVDAGTGIRNLGKEVLRRPDNGGITLLISHTHWDHIQGLPFFKPLYKCGCKVNIYADAKLGESIDQVFETQWDPNFFPVTADLFEEKMDYKRVNSGDQFEAGGFQIEAIKTHHSQGTLSFKIKRNNKVIVYMTDNELYYNAIENPECFDHLPELNSDLIKFCSGADYLIHDCMYKIDDYVQRIGWGHSNNAALAYFAAHANIKNLILFHYDPEYDDKIIDNMIQDTQSLLKQLKCETKCFGSAEGMEIEV